MVELTFLELHFEDANLTANAPYSHGEKDVVAGEEMPEEDSNSKRGALFALLVGLVFSVAVAYIVREKAFGDGSDDGESALEIET